MTEPALRRLLYISTARQPLAPGEREAILRLSRRNNGRVGVTGLLVTGGRRFMQVLEGDPSAVGATLDRIKADPRHFALVVLHDQRVADRAFGDWAMGHRAGSADTGADGSIAELIAPITDPSLHAYFEGFARIHARAA